MNSTLRALVTENFGLILHPCHEYEHVDVFNMTLKNKKKTWQIIRMYKGNNETNKYNT